MRKQKRTAGQRRFLALKKQIGAVRYELCELQQTISRHDEGGRQVRSVYLMQNITEAIERLGMAER